MNNKLLPVILVAGLLVLGVFLYSQDNSKTEKIADQKIKVGMITTLSGGGSGLGIDVRDGFMLAVKGNNNISVITKDDQRKPDIAVQLADKMIQSDKVDV